jgi:transposase
MMAARRSSGKRSTGAFPDPPHPEQGFRTCLGVLALVKGYGPARVDAACRRGLQIRARP